MDPLDFIERLFLVYPVIELRGAGRFMPGDVRGYAVIPTAQAMIGDLRG